MLIRVLTLCALSATLVGCSMFGYQSTVSQSQSIPPFSTTIVTMDDVDANIGETVQVSGILTRTVDYEHGVIKTDAGLQVLVPNFATEAAGRPWGNYIGKRFTVIGKLFGAERPHMDQQGKWQGPGVNAEYFKLSE